MSSVSVVLGVISTTTLYVDGDTGVSGGGLLVGYTSDTGFWHLGWAPTSVTSLTTAYFKGTLSNFEVFNTAGAPSAPTAAQRGSQAAFSGWASPATDRWLLGDSGTSTYAGVLPVLGSTSPCTMVDIGWTFTNPAGTASSSTTKLSVFSNGTPHGIAAPDPNTNQASTITTSRDGTYNSYISGLHLYAPLSHRVQTKPIGSGWSQTFTWAGPESAFIG
jgi:hypothetical protein